MAALLIWPRAVEPRGAEGGDPPLPTAEVGERSSGPPGLVIKLKSFCKTSDYRRLRLHTAYPTTTAGITPRLHASGGVLAYLDQLCLQACSHRDWQSA